MHPQVYRLPPSGYPDIRQQQLKLAANDLLNPTAIYVPVSLFFSVPDGKRHSTTQQLMAGLKETLGQCRFLAGTIERNGSGEYYIVSRLESTVDFIRHDLDQDGAGQAPFPSYDALEANRFRIPNYSNKARLRAQTPLSSQNASTSVAQPVIFCQANFISGGMVLTIHFHHWAMDYCAFAAFVHQWAGNTYSLTHNLPCPGVEPACLDRSRLLQQGASFPERLPVDSETVQMQTEEPGVDPVPAKALPISVYLFTLPKKKAEALKASVMSEVGGESCRISSYDAFLALWWRLLTRARVKLHNSQNLDAPADLVEAVNIRRKLVPPLPDRYLGNAVLFASSMSQKKQKLTIAEVMDSAPLSTIASYIRGITESVDAGYIEKQLRQIQRDQPGADEKRVLDSLGALAFTVNDWRAHNLYGADFGFGKPTAVRHLFGVMPVLVVLPVTSAPDSLAESFEFLVPVENDAIDSLVCDPDLRAWFEFHGVESEG